MSKESDLIRKKRRELDLSQENIALELGVSQKSYSDIENGKTKLKSETLCKISEILHVSPDKICPIANKCENESDIQLKHELLVDYLKRKNIDFPNQLI